MLAELGSPESALNRCGGRKLSGCLANGDDCSSCGRVVCSFCGHVVVPRVGYYWFMLLAPRGRCQMPGTEELRLCLCGPCGRRARQLLEANGFDPEFLAAHMTGGPE